MKQRARSCPKLPTYGPDLDGRPSWPPKPVLSHQPRQEPIAPKDPAPFWSKLRQDADTAGHTSPPLVPRVKKVPPLRGHPYLKGIQDFAAKHRSRAAEVLGPVAAAKISAAMGDKAASSDETALPEDVVPIPREPARASKSNGFESGETPKQEVLVSASSPSRSASPYKQAKSATKSPQSPQLDDGVYDDEEVDEGVDTAVEVAQLWGKWPPSVGSRTLLGAVRSETPTTRPPSQGDGFTSGPSSKPGSRPSTRTSSHGAGLGFQGALPLSRPSSSPAIGMAKRRSIHPPMSRQPMERPVSSPGLHGHASSRPRSGARGTPYLVKNSSTPVVRGTMR